MKSMKLNLYNINIFNELSFYGKEFNENEVLIFIKKELNKKFKLLNKIIDVGIDNLSDKDYYNFICDMYDISLDTNDYLEIISNIKNKKYNNFIKIDTFMVQDGIQTEGHGKSFDWWNQKYYISYVIATAEGVDISENEQLSKKDIKSLIKDNSIVIVDEELSPLNFKIEKCEKYTKFPMISFNANYDEDSFYYQTKMFGFVNEEKCSIIIPYLKKKLNKKRVLKDLRKNVIIIQNQVNELINNKYYDDQFMKIINELNINNFERKRINEKYI